MSTDFRGRELVLIRCRGCRRGIGVSTSAAQHPMWCDELCARDYPATEQEFRNSVMRTMRKCENFTEADLGREFGLTRQSINKILST